VRLAHRYKVQTIPFGGGSGIVGGSIPEDGEIMIDVKKLRDFSINAVNGTATGGAGLSGADFENLLNAQGFTAGHYPQSFQSAVLGGMASTRAIGTFSTKYGKMDDMVNSLEVVLPDGRMLKTPSAPKRSTGPELKELFLGAEGVYGIVTAVEMKIYPVAEKRAFEAYTFPTTAQGLEAIRRFVQAGIRPAVVRLYDEVEATHKIGHYGFEEGYALLIMGYEGLEKMVDLEMAFVKDTCLAHGALYKGEQAGREWFWISTPCAAVRPTPSRWPRPGTGYSACGTGCARRLHPCARWWTATFPTCTTPAPACTSSSTAKPAGMTSRASGAIWSA